MPNNGKRGEFLFSYWMEQMGYKVEDVSANPEYWPKDIDFLITSPHTGATKAFEVKWDTRINQTGNLYLETYNKKSIVKPCVGWYNYSQADYLVYGDANAECFYIVPFAALRERVSSLSLRTASCDGGDSQGLLINLRDIQDIVSVLGAAAE